MVIMLDFTHLDFQILKNMNLSKQRMAASTLLHLSMIQRAINSSAALRQTLAKNDA